MTQDEKFQRRWFQKLLKSLTVKKETVRKRKRPEPRIYRRWGF